MISKKTAARQLAKNGSLSMKSPVKKPLNSFQIIVLGFAGVILAGALLLRLPISSSGHHVTPFLDALFTSTTSVCVTSLVVVDTGTYWSFFGQTVDQSVLALLRKNHLRMEQQRPDPGRKNWNQRQTLPRRFKPTSELDTECCGYDVIIETPVSQIKIKKNRCYMVLTSTQQRFML